MKFLVFEYFICLNIPIKQSLISCRCEITTDISQEDRSVPELIGFIEEDSSLPELVVEKKQRIDFMAKSCRQQNFQASLCHTKSA